MAHPLYEHIHTIEDVRTFMEHHVFAVWDFMSLLKVLQRRLTCIDIPWLPAEDDTACRLINEIVLGEESDEDNGGYTSHFAMYLDAMAMCGADLSRIGSFIDELRRGMDVRGALVSARVPAPAARFVGTTWEFIDAGSVHAVAAAFTLGREDVIPDMFRALVADLRLRFPGQLDRFHTYLERHIHLDEEHHTPMALRMLQGLCGDDERRWTECARAASKAIEARIALWDGIDAAIAGRADVPSTIPMAVTMVV